jgi:very-short-patch-repair endonuclease
VLSRYSAAGLWLPARVRGGEPVDVAVFRGRAAPRPGINVRTMHSLRRDEITVHDGIPITTPARTLYDLADAAGERELERMVVKAFAQRLVDRSGLLALLDRHAGRPGATRLRAIIEAGSGHAPTRSEAEERFLALIRKARLHAPDVNARVAGYEVDLLWRAERLVVEVDGRAFHTSGRRFESDRRRDADLLAAGVRVMRVTWQQIVSEPEAVLIRLAMALARPAEV